MHDVKLVALHASLKKMKCLKKKNMEIKNQLKSYTTDLRETVL